MDITETKFWAKVDKTDSCWLWTASKRYKGYGAFTYRKNGRVIQGRAHRYSYELHKGEIPLGLFVLHECDTPSCVNPAHLFLGTNEDNVKDMMTKGRHISGGTLCGNNGKWPRGEKHHAAKMNPSKIQELKTLRANGSSYTDLSTRFNIGLSTIFKILKGRTWKQIK